MAANHDWPSGEGSARQFATTHWSVVLAAGQENSPTAHTALERLCCIYWRPLYTYIRRKGYSPEDAQDLTQEFFARLLVMKNRLNAAIREKLQAQRRPEHAGERKLQT